MKSEMKASYVQKEMELKLQLCLFWRVYFLGLLIKALVWKMKDSLFLFMKSVKAAEDLCLQEEVSLLCDWFYYVFVARKNKTQSFLTCGKVMALVSVLPSSWTSKYFVSVQLHSLLHSFFSEAMTQADLPVQPFLWQLLIFGLLRFVWWCVQKKKPDA